MGLFGSSEKEDKVMGSFILSEIRDLRKGMEGRDGELRGEIAAVRDAVATLSESVTHSHSKVDGIQSNVDTISKDVVKLRREVDDIQKHRQVERVKQGSAWDGPKRVLATVIALGAGAGAISAIVKFWPFIVTALI